MFVIRELQLHALGATLVDPPAARLAEHLRKYFSRELAAEALEQFARDAVVEAQRYRLHALPDLLLFGDLAAVHGLDWARNPRLDWLHAIMIDPIGSPTQRLKRALSRSLYLAESR
jgi:hypothetical protein